MGKPYSHATGTKSYNVIVTGKCAWTKACHTGTYHQRMGMTMATILNDRADKGGSVMTVTMLVTMMMPVR